MTQGPTQSEHLIDQETAKKQENFSIFVPLSLAKDLISHGQEGNLTIDEERLQFWGQKSVIIEKEFKEEAWRLVGGHIQFEKVVVQQIKKYQVIIHEEQMRQIGGYRPEFDDFEDPLDDQTKDYKILREIFSQDDEKIDTFETKTFSFN